MPSFKITLRSDKIRTNGEAPLYLRIIHERQQANKHTGVTIDPVHWNDTKQSVRRSHPNYKALNDQLDKLSNQAQAAYLDLSVRGRRVTSQAIKREVERQGVFGFFDYAEAYAETWREKSVWEFKKVHVLINKLRAFCSRKDLAFLDIDFDFIERFDRFMEREYSNKKSTRQKNLQLLKSVIKRAVKEGEVSAADNPFVYYTIGSSRGSRVKLPHATIQKIEALDLPNGSRQELARDLFVFAFYCHGIRFGDLVTLRRSNVVDGRLEYVTMKSSKPLSLVVPSPAERIRKKYAQPDQSADPFLFPVLEENRNYSDRNYLKRRISSKNSSLNAALKEVARLAGTEQNVSFHVARHSFADYARKQGGNVFAISKALGHSKIATTEMYLSQMDQGAVDDLSRSLFG